MKLLTATSVTQGHRANDYDQCVEGELVRFDDACARARRDPDGGCGCGRGFAGMNSMRATTTVMVRDVPLSRDDLRRALASSLRSARYLEDADDLDAVSDEADELIELASNFDEGEIVERRLNVLRPRIR